MNLWQTKKRTYRRHKYQYIYFI